MASSMLPPLIGYLRGDIGNFSAKMAEATGIARAETGKMSTAFTGLAGIGKAAVIGLGAAAIGGAAASLKMASDFQKATEILHTQAGVAQKDVEQIRQGLLAMAPAVGIGPTQLAEGFYHVASAATQFPPAMRNVNSELDIFNAAVKLSKIGNADLQDSTQAVVGTVAAFGREGLTAAQAAAQLNAIVGAGDMRMQQLTAAMATGVLPAAATFGLKLTDVGAALATLTDNVTPADEAATRLRMTFSLLGAPSGAAQKALLALGINATQLGYDMRKPDGLLVALGDLKSHLGHIDVSGIQGGLGTVKAEMEHFGFTTDQVNNIVKTLGPDATEQAFLISKAFGGGRSSAAIMTLLTEFDSFKEKYKVINAGASQFGDAWTSTQATFSARMDRMKAGLEALGVTVGTRLMPYVERAMDAFGNLAQWMSRNQQVSIPLAAVLGGILVVAIAAYTAAMIGAAAATIAATWPVLLIIAALVILGVGIYLLVTHWKLVTTAIMNFLVAARQVIGHIPILGFVLETLISIVQGVIAVVRFMIDHWNQVTSTVGEVFSTLGRFGDWLKNTFGPILSGISGFVGGLAKDISNLSSAVSNIPGIGGALHAIGVPGAQAGGPYPGRGALRVVGERGPELFASSSPGTIIPNDQLRGMGGHTINVYAQTNADPYQIAREIPWALKYQ